MTIDAQMIETANRLVNEFGTDHIVSLQEIYLNFSKKYKRNKKSVIPSDYCYNRINNGIKINKPTVFEFLGSGQYRCLGLNYLYNGSIYHKPRGQIEFVVGKCVNGERIIAPDSSYDFQITSNSERPVFKSKNQSSIGHKTKREPSMRLRFEILKRDNFKCCACGASPAKDPMVELHIDHIIPWSKGGETTAENIQTLCSKCNIGKSDIS